MRRGARHARQPAGSRCLRGGRHHLSARATHRPPHPHRRHTPPHPRPATPGHPRSFARGARGGSTQHRRRARRRGPGGGCGTASATAACACASRGRGAGRVRVGAAGRVRVGRDVLSERAAAARMRRPPRRGLAIPGRRGSLPRVPYNCAEGLGCAARDHISLRMRDARGRGGSAGSGVRRAAARPRADDLACRARAVSHLVSHAPPADASPHNSRVMFNDAYSTSTVSHAWRKGGHRQLSEQRHRPQEAPGRLEVEAHKCRPGTLSLARQCCPRDSASAPPRRRATPQEARAPSG